MLIHTDASLSDEVVGVGIVIRDEGRTYKNNFYVEGEFSSVEAEYIAMKKAAEQVSRMFDKRRHVFFYTDCQSVADNLSDSDSGKWVERQHEISDAVNGEWTVKWVPRERNTEADELAHVARRQGAA